MGSLPVLARASVDAHGVTLPGHAGTPKICWTCGSRTGQAVVACPPASCARGTKSCTSSACAWARCWRWNCATRVAHPRRAGVAVGAGVPGWLEHALVPGLALPLYHLPGVPRAASVWRRISWSRRAGAGLRRSRFRAAMASITNGCRWPACASRPAAPHGQARAVYMRCPVLVLHAVGDGKPAAFGAVAGGADSRRVGGAVARQLSRDLCRRQARASCRTC